MYGDSDTKQAAHRAAPMLGDQRVVPFYDPEKLAGTAVAAVLGGGDSDVAWDVYLFYRQGDMWLNQPPEPADWMHQLSMCSWADPARLRCGEELVAELQRSMERFFR